MEEDSKWVAAAAAPHRWSVGGPGPHLRKRTQTPRKVLVWGARQKKPLSFPAQKAVQVPKKTWTHISCPFSTERKKK